MWKRVGIPLLVAGAAVLSIEIGGQILLPGVSTVVSSAQAEVGRPLTPVSVAGVARRTARRCAAGVYNC